MSKQERRRVRVAASLGLTVLMSSAILGGVAPLTANAAEVGSEPTTTEVSPMITAPENPSDSVSSLPASEGSAATDETPVIEPDQTEEGTISTSEQAPAAEDPREKRASKKDQEPRDEVSSANPVITEKVLPDEVLGAQWGDVDWTFENGVLTLSGGTGVDTREVSPWREIASEVTKVEVLDQITAPADISSLFYGFTSVTEFVGLEKIDTSNVTSMLETFALTRSLTTIDLTSWNVSRLNDVEDLFKESGIVSLDLSNWQTDVFEYTDNMFASMPALEYLDISKLVFAEGADLFGSYAPSLRTLALGSETLLANVPTEANHLWRGENTDHTFVQSYSGGSADVYRLESDATEGLWGSVTWRVENDVLYLSGGEGVSTEGASPWAELESVIHSIVIEGEIIAPEDISALFANFNDVSSYEGLEKLDVSETTDMSHMFENNFSLWVLNVDNWDTSKVTNMSYMFSDNYSSALHDLSAWDTSKVTDMSHMFENNYGVQTRDLSHWDISSVTDMSHMFGNNYNVTAYDLSGWDTHSVTNMSYMFENNYSVNGHNLDGWNTSKVTNMSYIFANNYSARSIDVSNWDTSGVTDMSYMFAENYYIPSLDLSNWDTKSVTNMNSMFYSCHTLAQVGFENWNVRAVDDIGHFLEYTPMKSLDLSKWQFSGDNAYRAFASMSELQAVDISGFDLINAYKYEMLSTLPNLTEITLGENTTLRWSLDQISGKVWQGDLTGHQFGPVYNGGYPDTYRLTEGTLGYYGIDWIDNHNNERISDILLYGKPGETLSLSQVSLPAGYELSDPDEAVQLSEDEDTWTWNDVYLDRVVATTTRTIQFQGLPEGHLKDEVQEIKWHWDRLQGEAIPQNRSLRYYEDVIHLPQGGYDEFIVPQVEGYKADIAVVPLKTFDGEITALPDNETVTVTYTKLDSGDGGDQTTDPTSPGTNTGNGTIGGGQMTNLSTGDSSVAQDKALPQTGSQIASGLTLLGLGLLGLLGFTKRRKRN